MPEERERIEQRRAMPDAVALEDRRKNQEATHWSRVWRAVMLSPRVEVCDALLRGETVPMEKLDPEWVERFGRRQP